MATNMTDNRPFDYAIRAAQLLLALLIIGTDGYAIHQFHGWTEIIHLPDGDITALSTGVPDEWGFLIFCACWTILIVVFHLLAGNSFAYRSLLGYVRVGVEAIAVISWFAGFIAVAVSTSTEACKIGTGACGSLNAAAAFGSFEWALFMITTAQTFLLVFKGSRRAVTSIVKTDATV